MACSQYVHAGCTTVFEAAKLKKILFIFPISISLTVTGQKLVKFLI